MSRSRGVSFSTMGLGGLVLVIAGSSLASASIACSRAETEPGPQRPVLVWQRKEVQELPHGE